MKKITAFCMLCDQTLEFDIDEVDSLVRWLGGHLCLRNECTNREIADYIVKSDIGTQLELKLTKRGEKFIVRLEMLDVLNPVKVGDIVWWEDSYLKVTEDLRDGDYEAVDLKGDTYSVYLEASNVIKNDAIGDAFDLLFDNRRV